MANALPYSETLRPGDLPADRPHAITLEPDAAARQRLAEALGLRALRKLRFTGQLKPLGRRDWRLEATLGATVVQDCVVTLDPVTTRIDDTVARTYLAEMPELPEGDEIEMPEDDSLEPLPVELDLGAVMTEALALALPAYPHAKGVDPVDMRQAPPGADPLDDAAAKPFAGLAALRDKLGKTGKPED